MADPVITDISADGKTRKIVWTLTTADANGTWIKFNAFRDRCVSFTGTFGAATYKLMGSNDDGTGAFMLNDPVGTDITGTSAGMFQVLESPLLVRPYLSAVGVGATISVVMVLSRS